MFTQLSVYDSASLSTLHARSEPCLARLFIFHAVCGISVKSSFSDVVDLPCHPYPAAVWRLGCEAG